ncbi:hypothetical protein BW731_07640 [Vagococcus martis]|uniref:HTH cro/C1-type domain-containing protein n=1 Tax=Vagococcus martis TaxID=1768210 RepID=A0A1V4DHX0_9ENTE|nr:recombinase family protein [Vagococcus martis]OPF88053.1 hypothetical protein BW731_07640 [Vagococcus martis]
MTKFGYVRKDYPDETLSQVKNIMEYGCDELFIENSDLTLDKELFILMNRLSQGDTLVVSSLLVFGKSSSEFHDIISSIIQKKAELISIKEKINTKQTYSFQTVLKLLDMVNKEVTSKKIKQQLMRLRENGKQLGRPTVDQGTIDMIKFLRKNKQLNLRQIAEKCDVSIGTVHKYVS